MLWDNFVKTHIVCDPLVGNPHLLANEVLNRTLIGLIFIKEVPEMSKHLQLWLESGHQTT